MADRRRVSLWVPGLLAIMAGLLLAGIWVSQQQEDGSSSWGRAPAEVQAVMWPEPNPLPDFTLQDQHGRTVGRELFTGQWSFVFFGYLGCPDVCPLSLQAMAGMRAQLIEAGAKDSDFRFVFVSVDPDNDRPEQIREYLAWHDGDFVGLLGEPEELDRLARSMAVKYVEFVSESGYRSIDHTSSVMIVDPRGRVVGALSAPLTPNRMVEQFQRLRAWL